MEHLYEGMIEVNVLQIVKLLEHEVTGIVQNVAARVLASRLPESLESNPVVKVFARMDLITDVDTCLVKGVQDWQPSLRQFFETVFDQSCRTLWPRVYCVPHERAGERGMRIQSEILARLGSALQLLHSPRGTIFWIAPQLLWSKAVEKFVVCRMYSNQLPLQMRRKFRDLNTCRFDGASPIVAVVLAFGRLLQ